MRRTIVCVPLGIVSDGQPDYDEPFCIYKARFLRMNPDFRSVQDLHTYLSDVACEDIRLYLGFRDYPSNRSCYVRTPEYEDEYTIDKSELVDPKIINEVLRLAKIRLES